MKALLKKKHLWEAVNLLSSPLWTTDNTEMRTGFLAVYRKSNR